MPLYQGGAAASRVRQAQALRGQLLEQAIGVERLVISNARAAFASYQAANEAIESNTIAVAANQLALEGTRAEQTVGTRNILDVLNAEQELLNSQVLLVTARRDAYVAGFQLLNVMGMAEAEDLNLDGGPLYDPTINYNRYAGSWSDWDDGPRIVPVSTRTAPRRCKQPRDSAAALGHKALVMGDIQQDPSMEEILASIKRVIAEDTRAASTAAPRPPRRIARPEVRARGGRARARRSGLRSVRPALRRCRHRQPPAARQPLGAAPAQRGGGRRRRPRSRGPRDAAAGAQGLARPAFARDRRGPRHPRDRRITAATSNFPQPTSLRAQRSNPELRCPLDCFVARLAMTVTCGRPGARSMNKLMLAGLGLLAFAQAPAAIARPITATDLATMRRLGSPSISPDGAWAVYQLSETDLAANRRRNDLWLLDLRRAGAEPVRIASAPEHNEHDPHFSADGRAVYFLSDASGSDQLWRVALPGGTAERVTDFATDIGGYLLAPSGDRIAIWADRNLACADINCANLPAAAAGRGSGRVYDATFVRHWDTWSEPGVRSRIFTFALADGRPQGGGIAVSPNLVGDAPSKPFGGAEELAWSADGRTLYFTLREAGRHEPNSTNLDIFAVPADGGAPPVNLTAANRGMDTLPAVSPDGRWLAYAAMARPTYEADRQIVQLRNLATGETRALTQGWDRSVGSIAWAPDGRGLYVTAGDTLDDALFRVDIRTGRVTRLTEGGTAGNVVPARDGAVYYTLNSLQAPDDLYRLGRRGPAAQLTRVNADKLAELDPVSVRRFHFAGAHGDTVWGQIVEPANATGRLPTLLLIHGGPQGSFGNGWSYRWNPWVFAAPGYGAVTVDFHGSTGYGQAFTDAINHDWGGAPLEDLRLGLAAAGREDAQARHRQCLRAGRLLWRLHGRLDRRQLARRLQMPGQP